MNRRTFMTHGTGALLGLAGSGISSRTLAQERSPSAGMIQPNHQQAIDFSLNWLARQQHQGADAGAWGTGGYRGNVAVTALSALALMAGGHQPGRGRFGEQVTRAVRHILSCEEQHGPNAGFLSQRQAAFHGPMYGHGFATLFLAEVYGMINEPALRDQLRATLGRSVGLILRSQNNNRDGAWRYTPSSHDADLSVTVCQIMALRAARNAGINVPRSNADRCTEYVKRCQDQATGGFRYQAGAGGAQFARSAAGVVALNSAGIYLESPRDGDLVRRGLDYLARFRPGGGGGGGLLGNAEVEMHYYYGHYYAVQAMWTAGGNYWRQWYPAIRDELLSERRRNQQSGSWQQGLTMCPHYCTAMALIILQVPNNYLPILQR